MKDLNISVVIPNYNGVHLFPETLPTIFEALAATGLEYEIVLVDDRSTDNSVKFIQENFPTVRLVVNDENLGFAKTINKGILAAEFDLVLLLNSDVKLTRDYFIPQLGFFNSDDTFGVNGQIIGWDDDKIQDAAKYPLWHGFKLKFSQNYITSEAGELHYSLYLSGANGLVNREKLIELGGFNEDYSPFYVEDADLSVRAWRFGWKCYFEPAAVCRHRTSTSIRLKEKKTYIKIVANRNKLYFHHFHLNGWYLWAWQFQMYFELLFRMLLLQTWYFKSFKDYLARLSSLYEKKNLFEQKATLSLGQVVESIRQKSEGYTKTFFKS